MTIQEIKEILKTSESLKFQLEDGSQVPSHFHVTEVGIVTKDFIDCGGTRRFEKVANFQLWNADDTDHRLEPGKLLSIIELSEKTLGMGNLDIEVEYQSSTIGKYKLAHQDGVFILKSTLTACLAPDLCVPESKSNVEFSLIGDGSNSCTPGGGCC